MKRLLTIGITSVALAATLSVVTVRARSPEAVVAAHALPASQIVTSVAELGLSPIGQPVQRGPYYVLHAYDQRGQEVRVVADAQLGDVLSVTPLLPLNAYTPSYNAGPRIIHVPQPGEEDAASAPHVRRVMPDDDDDAVEQAAPPPRRQSAPRPQKQNTSAAPPAPRRKPYGAAVETRPAPAERRTVLRAPLHDGPSPVKPTPRFAKETGSKFPPSPPPGYTPPSNLPQEPAPAETAAQEPAPEPALDAAPQGE